MTNVSIFLAVPLLVLDPKTKFRTITQHTLP